MRHHLRRTVLNKSADMSGVKGAEKHDEQNVCEYTARAESKPAGMVTFCRKGIRGWQRRGAGEGRWGKRKLFKLYGCIAKRLHAIVARNFCLTFSRFFCNGKSVTLARQPLQTTASFWPRLWRLSFVTSFWTSNFQQQPPRVFHHDHFDWPFTTQR